MQLGLIVTALCALLGPAEAWSATNSPPKPNLIVILTDDLGYADLGAQGHERDVRTPNLDRLVHDAFENDRSELDGGTFTIAPPKQ